MPITKSAKKALRGSAKKRRFNERRKDAVRRATKGLKKLLAAGESGKVSEALSKAYQALDKAAKRGVLKKNTAARRKSLLASLAKKNAKA